MARSLIRLIGVVSLAASPALAQPPAQAAPLPPGQTTDPFPAPIAATEGVIRVNVREFASLPDIDGVAARMMLLVDEPGTRRLFVNDMRGPLYSVSYDGKTVATVPRHQRSEVGRGRAVDGPGARLPELCVPSAVRPGAARADSASSTPTPTRRTRRRRPTSRRSNPTNTHDTVLLEWTAKTPGAAAYDGGPPRELIRLRQPFANHNAGHLAFNPTAAPGSAEFGLLYMGVADGGSGGDPMNLAQNLGSAFGKIFRIDPLGTSSANKKYGIPRGNPFVKHGRRAAGDLRLRRAQSAALRLGSAQRQHVPRRHRPEHRRGDQPGHGRRQPRLERVGGQLPLHQPSGGQPGEAARRSEGDVSRSPNGARSIRCCRATPPRPAWSSTAARQIPQLANLLIFADMPSGEIFYVSADGCPTADRMRSAGSCSTTTARRRRCWR